MGLISEKSSLPGLPIGQRAGEADQDIGFEHAAEQKPHQKFESIGNGLPPGKGGGCGT
jgi:hypothetical protein